jgi:zinc/manganese transport system substrate-binding protein
MKQLAALIGLWGIVLLAPVEARLNVVATTSDLAAIAREVGGDLLDLTTLARPTEDPHFVDARPSFIARLNKADVLLEGGADLESGWLGPLLDGARNPRLALNAPGRLRAAEGVELLEKPATLDRSQGDVHAAGNPHFLMDPVNATIVASNVAARFARLDPAAAESYRAGAARFSARLDAKLTEWTQALAPHRGARIVAYHNTWPYFARRFGVRVDLFLEPKPGIPPTPTHLAAVIRDMKRENVRVIFVEPYLNRKTAETIARQTGATVLDVAEFPGGVKGAGAGYLELMDHVVNSLARALGGERQAK